MHITQHNIYYVNLQLNFEEKFLSTLKKLFSLPFIFFCSSFLFYFSKSRFYASVTNNFISFVVLSICFKHAVDFKPILTSHLCIAMFISMNEFHFYLFLNLFCNFLFFYRSGYKFYFFFFIHLLISYFNFIRFILFDPFNLYFLLIFSNFTGPQDDSETI